MRVAQHHIHRRVFETKWKRDASPSFSSSPAARMALWFALFEGLVLFSFSFSLSVSVSSHGVPCAFSSLAALRSRFDSLFDLFIFSFLCVFIYFHFITLLCLCLCLLLFLSTLVKKTTDDKPEWSITAAGKLTFATLVCFSFSFFHFTSFTSLFVCFSTLNFYFCGFFVWCLATKVVCFFSTLHSSWWSDIFWFGFFRFAFSTFDF